VALIDSIRAVVGDDAAAQLIKLFGGRKVYVPLTTNDEHRISKAIGIQAAAALSRRFGGDYIDVPSPRVGSSALRRQILALASKDVSEIEIARRLGCTRRWVGTVLQRDA
jgi:hypothetical protein